MGLNRRLDKAEALITKDVNSATGEKYKLGETTKESVLAVISAYDLLKDFGSKLSVAGISAPLQGTNLINKHPNVSLTEKTGIAKYDDVEATSLDTVSIGWSKPRFAKKGITAFETQRGLGQVLGAFLAKAVEEGSQSRQLLGFKEIIDEDTKKAGNTLSPAVLSDAKQLRDRILTEASSFFKIVNDKEGIKGIKLEDIVIHVSAAEAFKLLEVIGNQALKQFENGLYSTLTLGGFTIRVNDLMPRVQGAPKVIISTNFVYKSFHAIIGAKTETVNGSFDLVAYYEDAISQGLVYSGLVKVLY